MKEYHLPQIEMMSHSLSSGTEWNLRFPECLRPALFRAQDLTEEILEFIEVCDKFEQCKDKYFQTILEGQKNQVLASIDFSSRRILFSTTGLRDELFYLKAFEKFSQARKTSGETLQSKLQAFTQEVMQINRQINIADIQWLTKKYGLVDLEEFAPDGFGEKERKVKGELQDLVNEYRPSLYEKMSDFGLQLSADFDLVRIHILKFLAVLPALNFPRSEVEVKKNFLEALTRLLDDNRDNKSKSLPFYLVLGTQIALLFGRIIPSFALAPFIRKATSFVAERFIAGESITDGREKLKELAESGRGFTLDQLGELVVSEREADHYLERVLDSIQQMKQVCSTGEKNGAGLYQAHVSIKVSALCDDFRPLDFEYTFDKVAPRLQKILLLAKEKQVFVHIDAEHYHYRDLVFQVYSKVLTETKELQDFQQTGIIIQAYLRDAYIHFRDVLALAKKRNLVMPIRLVKGAYWDAETIEAHAHSFPAPQFLNKVETDLHFRQLAKETLENSDFLQLCLAGHNIHDHVWSEVLRAELYPNSPKIEHQCLHMTFEGLSTAMSNYGWVVRNYVPIGDLIVGMGYLVRRIMENSSQVGILSQTRVKNHSEWKGPEEVLKNLLKQPLALKRDNDIENYSSSFANLYPLRAYKEMDRKAILAAIDEKLELYPLENTGEEGSAEVLRLESPNKKSHLLASVSSTSVEKVREFVESTDESWSRLGTAERASILSRAANSMIVQRCDLVAQIVHESGKSIEEAIADVDEAVDFIKFYCREAIRNRGHQDKSPLGVIAAITPWNFPLAIPCGMVVAPLVVGNRVVLKSAEQTPLIAQSLVDILESAGVPSQALIHAVGTGETIGKYLVDHPKVQKVVFTGSESVGTQIFNSMLTKSSQESTSYGAVTEMGGKNGIIVTSSSDLDEVVSGVLYAGFAHAGQKCSAASRLIVDEKIVDKLADRLSFAIQDLSVGGGDQGKTFINPLIEKSEVERIKKQAVLIKDEIAKSGGRVIVDRTHESFEGACVGPMLVQLKPEQALKDDSYFRKELFGPIIHLVAFRGLDQALELLHSTRYALTAGIYSQSEDDIEFLGARIECGNIYINRPNTGARVGIEPFGGFKKSGTGPKAGGPFYLSSFMTSPGLLGFKGEEKVEIGSDYDFQLKTPKISSERALIECQSFFRSLEQRLDQLSHFVTEGGKETLKEQLSWQCGQQQQFQGRPFSNRVIPGQLSYNDHSMVRKHCLLIDTLTGDKTEILSEFLLALSLGVQITILARNDYSFQFWGQIQSYLADYHILDHNLQVLFSSEKVVSEHLGKNNNQVIVLNMKHESQKSLRKQIVENQTERDFLPLVVSPLTHIMNKEYQDRLLRYILVRSFAINTMRYGAPLTLEDQA